MARAAARTNRARERPAMFHVFFQPMTVPRRLAPVPDSGEVNVGAGEVNVGAGARLCPPKRYTSCIVLVMRSDRSTLPIRVSLITAFVAATIGAQRSAEGAEPAIDPPASTASSFEDTATVGARDNLGARDNQVTLAIDLAGDVTVESDSGVARCYAPCVVRVPRGIIRLKTKTGDVRELVVEGASRVSMSRGVPAVRAAGLVSLGVGASVVVAAVVVPLFYCSSERTEIDAYGQRRAVSPCNDISDGVKVGWIAGAGIGLTAAIAGAIIYSSAGPRLQLSGTAPPMSDGHSAERRPGRVVVLPWVNLAWVNLGGPSGTGMSAGGAALLRF